MKRITIINLTIISALLICLFSPLITKSEEVINTSTQSIPEKPTTNYSVEELRNLSRSITVKIYSGQTSGSGILIKKEEGFYIVVTNDHVLSRGENDYRIQTKDGQIYPAFVIPNPRFKNYDLGLLKFSSDKEYQLAKLGNSNDLQTGDYVVATGFPIMADAKIDDGFNFTEGLVTLIPPKSLEEGYQIGYTNQIQKGMSGGPVINTNGEVVAINGMHAYPLWGDPYIYQDGEQPSDKEKEVMIRSSWAIPINTFAKLVN